MKGKNISIVVFEIVLLGILVFGSVRLAQAYGGGNPSNVGHTADEIAAGTFAAGSFTFPNNLIVNGNVGVGTAAELGVPLKVSGPGWNIKMGDSTITSNWAILTNNGGVKYLRFFDVDNSADRLVIDSSGRIGIGTASPSYKLQVNDPSNIAIQTNGEISTNGLSVSSALKPNVGVNTLRLAGGSHTIPTYATPGRVEVWDRISVASGYNYGTFPDPGPGGIYAVGTIYYGGLSGISDARFKENVVPLSGSLSRVSELQGVSFDWKIKEYPERAFSEGRQIGMIAQDVEKVVPELVSTDKEGYKSVDYAKMSSLLIEAVKEQQAQIDQLKAEVESLKSR